MNETETDGNLAPREAPERPGQFLGSADEHFRVLLAALDLGWQVEEPVYLRPRWGESGSWVYHFILKREATPQPCLVTVRHNPEVEQFIEQEGWQVDQPALKGSALEFLLTAGVMDQLFIQ